MNKIRYFFLVVIAAVLSFISFLAVDVMNSFNSNYLNYHIEKIDFNKSKENIIEYSADKNINEFDLQVIEDLLSQKEFYKILEHRIGVEIYDYDFELIQIIDNIIPRKITIQILFYETELSDTQAEVILEEAEQYMRTNFTKNNVRFADGKIKDYQSPIFYTLNTFWFDVIQLILFIIVFFPLIILIVKNKIPFAESIKISLSFFIINIILLSGSGIIANIERSNNLYKKVYINRYIKITEKLAIESIETINTEDGPLWAKYADTTAFLYNYKMRNLVLAEEFNSSKYRNPRFEFDKSKNDFIMYFNKQQTNFALEYLEKGISNTDIHLYLTEEHKEIIYNTFNVAVSEFVEYANINGIKISRTDSISIDYNYYSYPYNAPLENILLFAFSVILSIAAIVFIIRSKNDEAN